VDAREAAVEAVLREIGAAERPRLVVLNKSDLTGRERVRALAGGRPGCVLVSALTGEGLAELTDAVASRVGLEPRRVRLRFKTSEGRKVAAVYASGRVLGHVVEDGEVQLDAELPARLVERYREHVR
jgi:GTP-binding protein HflX